MLFLQTVYHLIPDLSRPLHLAKTPQIPADQRKEPQSESMRNQPPLAWISFTRNADQEFLLAAFHTRHISQIFHILSYCLRRDSNAPLYYSCLLSVHPSDEIGAVKIYAVNASIIVYVHDIHQTSMRKLAIGHLHAPRIDRGAHYRQTAAALNVAEISAALGTLATSTHLAQAEMRSLESRRETSFPDYSPTPHR